MTTVPPRINRRSRWTLAVESAAIAAGAYIGAGILELTLIRVFQREPWPYNIRQLDGRVRHLLMFADRAPTLTVALHEDVLEWHGTESGCGNSRRDERIADALRQHKKQVDVARDLGVHRTTVWRHSKGKKPDSDGV